jgi:hypothetical protein
MKLIGRLSVALQLPARRANGEMMAIKRNGLISQYGFRSQKVSVILAS